MAFNLSNIGNIVASPKKSKLSRDQGTSYNKSQYKQALNNQNNFNALESQRRNFGPAVFNNANTIYTAPLSSNINQPARPSMAGKTQKQYEDAMNRYNTAIAGNEVAAQEQKAAKEEKLEENKSQYESAMGEIKKLAHPKPQYIYDNVLDVFNPWDEEGNMRTPGPHMSNVAFVQKAIDSNKGKELADQYNADINPENIPDESSTSPEEAAAETYGQDATASVIDPVTGQAIPYSDLTLAGQQLAADDYAGHAAAQYLYGTEGLYDKYGDDWSKFQREGTYDEWKAVLSDPRMAQYFTNITTDKDFFDDNGNFDFDKYWQHAVTLDAMNTPELSDRDFALIYGDSSGVLNANNMWRRDMMQNSPTMYGLPIDINAEYPAEYQQYLDSLAQGENAPIYQDENGNIYYNGFGDNGLNNDQLLSLLNMQTMQDAMMTYGTPDAYSLNEANMLANMPGWNTTYSDEAAEGYSNNYGMPENFDLKTYNPYALNPNQLYYMLNGGDQVYDPTGYIMNEYMNTPAGLYYTRNS